MPELWVPLPKRRHCGPGVPDERLAQVLAAAASDSDELQLPARRHLSRHEAEPDCQITSAGESGPVAEGRDEGGRVERADTWVRGQPGSRRDQHQKAMTAASARAEA